MNLGKHKKTLISIVVSFAAMVFVFAFFPAAENYQTPVNQLEDSSLQGMGGMMSPAGMPSEPMSGALSGSAMAPMESVPDARFNAAPLPSIRDRQNLSPSMP